MSENTNTQNNSQKNKNRKKKNIAILVIMFLLLLCLFIVQCQLDKIKQDALREQQSPNSKPGSSTFSTACASWNK